MTPSSYYRLNPEQVLERKQERSCKGCIYLAEAFGKQACTAKFNRKTKKPVKCSKYREEE